MSAVCAVPGCGRFREPGRDVCADHLPDGPRTDLRLVWGLAAAGALLVVIAVVLAVVGVSARGVSCGTVAAPVGDTLSCERAVDDRRSLVWIIAVAGLIVAATAGWLWRAQRKATVA
ncbi:MAG TPA: hypothetical protein VGE43_19630 [Acidimicrobiales bacterium]